LVWRLCVALWLLVSTPFVLTFLAMLILPLWNSHPLSFFERRDPTACPRYYDRYDDELLACIHRANEAQFSWMATRLPVEEAFASAPLTLSPFWMPLAVWSLARFFRRALATVFGVRTS
jgi:hypothetical protein